MPFIRLSIAGSAPSKHQLTQLQRGATELMSSLLGKRGDLTVFILQSLPADAYSIAGEALPEQSLGAVMEAVITEGTNTAPEKAHFIKAAHELIVSVLGPVASPIYVAINEVAASDWGYDGATQAARRAATMGL